MSSIPESINRLIDEFTKFPGIGRKTAQRMAFYVLKSPNEQAVLLAEAIMDMKTKILFCSICGGITEKDPCYICTDTKRDASIFCVVEEGADIYAFEKTNSFRGLYHVLGGVLSPLDGIGPDDLNLNSLFNRVKPGNEVIIATNPSIEGDATALFIAKLFSDKNITVTRLARGLPVGSDLEYTDDATLMQAMEGRTIV